VTINLLGELSRDLTYAWRTMRKSPGFALTVISMLALGIGVNTAIFSAVHAVLLKPLAYREPDRLVRLSGGATLAHFDELKTGETFSEVGAFAIGMENMSLSGTAEPQMLKAARVSANFLHILGVEPVLGRGFLSEEDAPGAPAVAMISTELWQRRFNGDPLIIGKTITLAAARHVVVGIVPANFDFPLEQTDVWVTKPSEWSAMSAPSRRLSPFLAVFGRLKPGVNLDQASAELAVIQHRYALAHPTMLDAKPKGPVRAKLWKDEVVSKVQSMLWMLLGAVGFVLLIACSNVACLHLARGASRSRELAVRSALGANRTRLVVHLLSESLLLSIVGGLLGILIAALLLSAVSRTNFSDLPRAAGIHLDGSVLAFAGILSIAAGVLFGLAPSISASRLDILPILKVGGDSMGRLRSGLKPRSLLVIGQVALSIILLIGASLLIESVMYLRATNPRFNPEHLLTTQITLSPERYDTDGKRAAFFEEVVYRVEYIPGVRSATIALTLPMTPFPGTPVQDAAQTPLKVNERPIATALIVTPGIFVLSKSQFGEGETLPMATAPVPSEWQLSTRIWHGDSGRPIQKARIRLARGSWSEAQIPNLRKSSALLPTHIRIWKITRGRRPCTRLLRRPLNLTRCLQCGRVGVRRSSFRRLGAKFVVSIAINLSQKSTQWTSYWRPNSAAAVHS
jgi:predicted permease